MGQSAQTMYTTYSSDENMISAGGNRMGRKRPSSDADDYAVIDLDDSGSPVDNGSLRAPLRSCYYENDVRNAAMEAFLREAGLNDGFSDFVALRSDLERIGTDTGDSTIDDRDTVGPETSLKQQLQVAIDRVQAVLRKVIEISATRTASTDPDRTCSCCQENGACLEVSFPEHLKADAVAVCQVCYDLAKKNMMTRRQALMVQAFLTNLFTSANNSRTVEADKEVHRFSLANIVPQALLKPQGKQIVGNVEIHLRHHPQRRLLSMALLNVSLSSHFKSVQDSVQVQTCLLRTRRHRESESERRNRRLSSQKSIGSEGKTRWLQLFEWPGIEESEMFSCRLQISVWRCHPPRLIGVAAVPMLHASNDFSTDSQTFDLHYNSGVDDAEQVSFVPDFSSSPSGARPSRAPSHNVDPAPSARAVFSRFRALLGNDRQSQMLDSLDDPSVPEVPTSTSVHKVAITRIEYRDSTNADDDYWVEQLEPTVTITMQDEDGGRQDTPVENPRLSLLSNSAFACEEVHESPLTRHSATSATKTADGTYFVYPVSVPLRFGSMPDLLTVNSDSNDTIDGTLIRTPIKRKPSRPTSSHLSTPGESCSRFSRSGSKKVGSAGSGELMASPVVAAVQTHTTQEPMTDVQSQCAGAAIVKDPDQVSSSRLDALIYEAKQVKDVPSLKRTETLQRLVEVREKLYEGILAASFPSSSSNGSTTNVSSCPVSVRTSPEPGSLPVNFNARGNSRSGRPRPSSYLAAESGPLHTPAEISLSWIDNGHYVAVTVKEARHISLQGLSGRSSMPSGLICKAHLTTRDGRLMKAKTGYVRYSASPKFNDTLEFDASSRGGELKVSICSSHGRVGRQEPLYTCQLVWAASSPPSVTGGATSQGQSVAQSFSSKARWLQMQQVSAPQRSDSHRSTQASPRFPRVLSLLSGRRRLTARRKSVSTGNLL